MFNPGCCFFKTKMFCKKCQLRIPPEDQENRIRDRENGKPVPGDDAELGRVSARRGKAGRGRPEWGGRAREESAGKGWRSSRRPQPKSTKKIGHMTTANRAVVSMKEETAMFVFSS